MSIFIVKIYDCEASFNFMEKQEEKHFNFSEIFIDVILIFIHANEFHIHSICGGDRMNEIDE